MSRIALCPIVLLLFCVAATSAAPAQTVDSIDAKAILATVQTLSSREYEGRATASAGGIRARDWIVERFKAVGLQPIDGTYKVPFSFIKESVKREGTNLVGMCKGRGTQPEVTVISAHYDHLGIRDGVIYPGADDNASGVAVMLAIAERCRREPFRHDTLFVAFDAEELGLQGAKAFVANPPVPKQRLRLNINLDMVSRSDRRELYAAGTYHWPKTKPPLEQVARRAPITLLFGHDNPASRARGMDDWTNQSDHGPFHQAGVPFVYFGVEDHADYHKPTDTADKINPAFFRDAAQTILDAVTTLDAAPSFNE